MWKLFKELFKDYYVLIFAIDRHIYISISTENKREIKINFNLYIYRNIGYENSFIVYIYNNLFESLIDNNRIEIIINLRQKWF